MDSKFHVSTYDGLEPTFCSAGTPFEDVEVHDFLSHIKTELTKRNQTELAEKIDYNAKLPEIGETELMELIKSSSRYEFFASLTPEEQNRLKFDPFNLSQVFPLFPFHHFVSTHRGALNCFSRFLAVFTLGAGQVAVWEWVGNRV